MRHGGELKDALIIRVWTNKLCQFGMTDIYT